jgi:menaquinone-dependent protoporphyrinogen IX oxidase
LDKILVTYSSWSGATHQIAEEIFKQLRKNNPQVYIADSKNVESIGEYQYIILGTPVHAGKMTGEFNKFLKRFYRELVSKKIAFFVDCFNMIEDNEKNRMETLGWLNKAIGKYSDIQPVSIGLFAGATVTESEEFNKLNVLVKKLIESMKKSMNSDKGKSDFREWDKIQSWTTEIAEKLFV